MVGIKKYGWRSSNGEHIHVSSAGALIKLGHVSKDKICALYPIKNLKKDVTTESNTKSYWVGYELGQDVLGSVSRNRKVQDNYQYEGRNALLTAHKMHPQL